MPSDQYRIMAVSDCRRNASFAVTLNKGTSVQNTFKPYYSRWVFKLMCSRGLEDSCLIERYVNTVFLKDERKQPQQNIQTCLEHLTSIQQFVSFQRSLYKEKTCTDLKKLLFCKMAFPKKTKQNLRKKYCADKAAIIYYH